MPGVAGTAPLGAEGRVCSSRWWGVTSQALPRGDQRVPRPGQVGARNSARGHPRRVAGGAGLAAGQLSAVARVLGKGKQGVLARASGDRVPSRVRGLEAWGEHGVRSWRWQLWCANGRPREPRPAANGSDRGRLATIPTIRARGPGRSPAGL
jgi:hypothetical protein